MAFQYAHSHVPFHIPSPLITMAVMNTTINGGISSPGRWDQKTMGYVGTSRMRYQPDTMKHRAVGPNGTRWQEGEASNK